MGGADGWDAFKVWFCFDNGLVLYRLVLWAAWLAVNRLPVLLGLMGTSCRGYFLSTSVGY